MPRRFVLALTWLAATCVAVFVALQAVGAVGRQVTDRPAPVARRDTSTPASAASTAPIAPLPASPSTTDTTTPAGTVAVPVTGSEPAPTVTTPPSAEPQTPQPEPAQESSASSPADTEPAPQPGPTTTYNLEGGSIGVRCTGSAIDLVYSSPAPGFSADVNSRGPQEVDVRFENDAHRSRIKVQCAAGSPVVIDEREED